MASAVASRFSQSEALRERAEFSDERAASDVVVWEEERRRSKRRRVTGRGREEAETEYWGYLEARRDWREVPGEEEEEEEEDEEEEESEEGGRGEAAAESAPSQSPIPTPIAEGWPEEEFAETEPVWSFFSLFSSPLACAPLFVTSRRPDFFPGGRGLRGGGENSIMRFGRRGLRGEEERSVLCFFVFCSKTLDVFEDVLK